MSDATERVREAAGYWRADGFETQEEGYECIEQLLAALDLIDALKLPPLGCTCGCERRFYSVVLRDHPSTTDFHAKAERTFEETIK